MSRNKFIFLISTIIFIVSIMLSLSLGASNLSLKDIFHAIFHNPDTLAGKIFMYVRLPRTIACIMAGSALAVSGAVIQAVLSNNLASPGIIGVNSGAGLAFTICCACGAISGWAIAISSFTGAFLAAMIVTITAQKINASRSTVILGGVAINSFFNAMTEGIINILPDAAALSIDFRIGGFSAVAYTRLIPASIIIIVALIIIFTLFNELDIIYMGEDIAHSLGLSVKAFRTIFLILAALLAGASVSFAGLLGFVGLIVPHICRRLVGNESKKLIPLCALWGAGFVTVCDLISRLAFMPYEVPVGIFLALLGGPFFIFLLIKNKSVLRTL